jgi:hypothetical protein
MKPLSADEVLMKTLEIFFSNDEYFNQMYKYICKPRESRVSLRVLEWFVINYSKKNNIGYEFEKDDGTKNYLIVFSDYQNCLKGYKKIRLDPFCRKQRKGVNNCSIIFKHVDKEIETTIGQLSFFKWAIANKVLDYVEQHVDQIEKDMNETNKNKKKNKKRQQLSIAATRTITTHQITHTVRFS